MKKILNVTMVWWGCWLVLVIGAWAQGNLVPPGAPAPTMKSLDQLEARTPISSAPFVISTSGSYYLTTNLAVSSGNAITIAANNVTLDLNGFTLSSTEPSPTGTGIQLGTGTGVANIAIRNGVIAGGVSEAGGVYGGSGFGYGISYSGGAADNVRVTGVSVSGCLYGGINLELNGTVVNSCTVNTVGDVGINAQSVSDSTAEHCGGIGIFATTAENCSGRCLGPAYGLHATTANNCHGYSSVGPGLYAVTANNCNGYGSTGKGLEAIAANNCSGFSTADDGVNALVANNCYGHSTSGRGVYAGKLAIGCFGQSSTGTGLWAFNANNCYGETASTSPAQYGLYAYDIAVGCYGSSGVGGVGIYGIVLNSCGGTSLSYSFKYNMP